VADYGFFDKLLHRLALQLTPVAEMSFDLDQKSSGADPAGVRETEHVFVSGLARAGTTILMRRLYASGDFCSLTYRHMPFVLAPNLWSRFADRSKRQDTPTERAHGDRILVNIDSPESLDEVFWRIFDAESYISETHLAPHDPDPEITAKFAAYVAAILKADSAGRTRYLSKNNNNILRLGALRGLFPKAVILIPFRDPLSHAGSLLRQHGNFVTQQQADPFVRAYMGWLGHHEFGLTHKPFRFDAAGQARLAEHSPDSLDYWLELWCQVYGWLEKTAPADAYFVCYEDLCTDPAVWTRLAGVCGLEAAAETDEPFRLAKAQAERPADPQGLEAAMALYGRLVARARS
jgi:hypothetical protein